MSDKHGGKFVLKSVVCGVVALLVLPMLSIIAGLFLNTLVMNANDGKMPVAYAEHDRLGTVILFPRFLKCEPPDTMSHSEEHTKFTSTTNFSLLVDRFLVRTLNECEARELPSLIETEFRRLRLVSADGEGVASIGDFLQWIGVFGIYISWLAAILAAPLVIFALLRSLRASASS